MSPVVDALNHWTKSPWELVCNVHSEKCIHVHAHMRVCTRTHTLSFVYILFLIIKTLKRERKIPVGIKRLLI